MKFVFSQGKLIVARDTELSKVPDYLKTLNVKELYSDELELVEYTSLDGNSHTLLNLHLNQIDEERWQLIGLRELLFHLPNKYFAHIAQAYQYAEFLKTHQFCGQCGSRMQRVHWEMAMHCHKCQHRAYPRVTPCIIVAVRKQDKILLAKGIRHQKTDMYSTLAGFVESSESLEEAVHREVFEEVGLKIKNLEYFGSQAWPFPHSIMCGYLAEYADGQIVIDDNEIVDANWYDINNMPLTPPNISIAARLIEETVNRIKREFN